MQFVHRKQPRGLQGLFCSSLKKIYVAFGVGKRRCVLIRRQACGICSLSILHRGQESNSDRQAFEASVITPEPSYWPSKVILWHQHRFLSGKSSCLLGHTAPGLPEKLQKTLHKCLRSDRTKTTVHIYKIKTANTKENRCSVQWLTIAMLHPIPVPSYTYYLWRFRGSRNQSVGYMCPLYMSFQITERKKNTSN